MSMEPIVFLNGAYLPRSAAHISPEDRGFLFGDGVYEVVRAYQGRLFRRDEHLARMVDGLAALEIDGPSRAELADVCETLLDRNEHRQDGALVYVQVTRGAAPRTHWFPSPPVSATAYAATSPFKPKADPRAGIAVITTPDIRWARCDIKTVNLIPNCLANQRARTSGAKEAVFVRDGIALEGTATSFFAVFDGAVWTAPRSNYILPSITRQVVIDLAEYHALHVEERPVPFHDLDKADELFLAGTTMEIMPIVQVDGRAVGTGQPGPVTQQLQALFWEETRKTPTAEDS